MLHQWRRQGGSGRGGAWQPWWGQGHWFVGAVALARVEGWVGASPQARHGGGGPGARGAAKAGGELGGGKEDEPRTALSHVAQDAGLNGKA